VRYLRVLLATTALILAAVVMLNAAVDPGAIVHRDEGGATRYADALIASKYGLWWPEGSYDDRGIKRGLARDAGRFDCVVIGSSHAMQVSGLAHPPALSGTCASILNLAVSGAGLEDQLTLAYLALSDGKPAKMILAVDPWDLAYGKDPRWSYYESDYRQARRVILGRTGDESLPPLASGIADLVSLDYTLRSLGELADRFAGGARVRTIVPAPRVDENVGGREPVLLPDGSLIYSASYLADKRSRPIPLGGIPYKIDGPLDQPDAIADYRTLLRWIRRQGVEPILLLTPYQQNVLKASDWPTARALRAIEPLVRDLARRERVRVIGSFDPAVAGCPSGEFLDFMHATTACLARLR
jgi:hypothetical protein